MPKQVNLKRVGAYVLLALVFFGAVYMFAFSGIEKANFQLSEGRTITLTEQGFTPEQLVVSQGDTVTFISEVKGEYWPASDSHPTHDIYSAFDPKEPIPEGASWGFTFDQPGTWRYHDHLHASKEGEIVVLDSRGKAPAASCEPGAPSSECYKEQVIAALNEKGLPAALDEMARLFDTEPAFKGTCHSAAHSLGSAAYDAYEKGVKIELNGKTSYCSFGFYHGFMEKMLELTGDVAEARKFCIEAGKTLSAESANAEGACYHGIGHGAVDGGDPRDWGDPVALIEPGLALCEQVDPTEPHFYRCTSGAFNSLAIMYMEGTSDLKLPSDPFAICTSWDAFRLRNPCYQEMNTLAARMSQGNPAAGIALVAKIPEQEYAALAMRSLAGVWPASFVAPFADDFARVILACHGARVDLRMPCIVGVPGGLMEAGTPGKEYQEALSFCAAEGLTANEELQCNYAAFGLIRAYYPKERQPTICAEVTPDLRDACLNPLILQ